MSLSGVTSSKMPRTVVAFADPFLDEGCHRLTHGRGYLFPRVCRKWGRERRDHGNQVLYEILRIVLHRVLHDDHARSQGVQKGCEIAQAKPC